MKAMRASTRALARKVVAAMYVIPSLLTASSPIPKAFSPGMPQGMKSQRKARKRLKVNRRCRRTLAGGCASRTKTSDSPSESPRALGVRRKATSCLEVHDDAHDPGYVPDAPDDVRQRCLVLAEDRHLAQQRGKLPVEFFGDDGTYPVFLDGCSAWGSGII